MTRRRLLIVQPYIPDYRVPFFRRLTADLHAGGVELTVAHGLPTGSQAQRGDAGALPGAVALDQHSFRLGGRTLLWRQLGELARQTDAVVLEQALHNLEALPLLMRQLAEPVARRGPLVAFWGHGRTYTKPVGRVVSSLKEIMTRRGSWFFAYSEGGAAHIAARGFPRDRITVLRNSVDTTEMACVRDRAGQRGTPEHAEARSLCERHRLRSGRTALFIGGLDASKRIPFLLESARRIAAELPGFRLLVAGEGPDRRLVEAAASQPGSPVVALGYATRSQMGLLGAVSDVMLMPGRVGLCAVDSFALRTPVVTTEWPWHAPEFEYLIGGCNALITPDDVDSYATAVASLLHDPARLDSFRTACLDAAADYTVEGMAARFRDGALRMLGERDT